MARLSSSQSKHDVRVSAEAQRYDSSGYDVWADVSGWSRPEIINGCRPDVIAKKGGHTSVVEVQRKKYKYVLSNNHSEEVLLIGK